MYKNRPLNKSTEQFNWKCLPWMLSSKQWQGMVTTLEQDHWVGIACLITLVIWIFSFLSCTHISCFQRSLKGRRLRIYSYHTSTVSHKALVWWDDYPGLFSGLKECYEEQQPLRKPLQVVQMMAFLIRLPQKFKVCLMATWQWSNKWTQMIPCLDLEWAVTWIILLQWKKPKENGNSPQCRCVVCWKKCSEKVKSRAEIQKYQRPE